VLPIAAFANSEEFPLDCDFPDGTPVIWSVENGPYITSSGQEIAIIAAGQVEVSNPLYDGPGGTTPRTVMRDYSFGSTQGTVTVGGVQLKNVVWTADSIRATVPSAAATGELLVTRSDNGKSTPLGLTMTIGPIAGAVHQVSPSASAGATPIQDAIDAANPGDLILVAPGQYDECVVMWKPLQLQGWGGILRRHQRCQDAVGKD